MGINFGRFDSRVSQMIPDVLLRLSLVFRTNPDNSKTFFSRSRRPFDQLLSKNNNATLTRLLTRTAPIKIVFFAYFVVKCLQIWPSVAILSTRGDDS